MEFIQVIINFQLYIKNKASNKEKYAKFHKSYSKKGFVWNLLKFQMVFLKQILLF